jgi:EmrB/QacA subfamily drug resistance transporter
MSPAPQAATAAVKAPPARVGRIVPLIIGCALFMQTLDSNVISNALPTMARALHESPLTLNLAITSYLLATVVFLPISGWIADRFGARKVFRVAICLFAFSSLLCGLSVNLPQLVGARLLQGLAGAMMTPVGRLLLLKTAPKAELVEAMNWVTLPALLGPVVGPPLGGLIVTYLSWGWIFFINVPIAAVGVILINVFIGEVREASVKPLDWRGFLLTSFGLTGVLFGCENISRGILPLWAVWVLIVSGAGALLVYVGYAKRTPHAILDLRVFRLPTFSTAAIGGSFARLTTGAMPFLLALLLQVGFGMSPIIAGFLTFASTAGALLMKVSATPILRRFGFRQVLLGNTVITALCTMSTALFHADTPRSVILGLLLIGGFFRSLQFTSLGALTFSDVPQGGMSNASTISSMTMPIAQSVGIVTAVALLNVVQSLRGDTAMLPADVTPVFMALGVISLGGLFFFFKMHRDAGAVVSGARTSRY